MIAREAGGEIAFKDLIAGHSRALITPSPSIPGAGRGEGSRGRESLVSGIIDRAEPSPQPSPGVPGEGVRSLRSPRRTSLPVIVELPDPAADLPLPEFPVGDPFNSHKILNHFDRLQKLVKGEIVYPITVEIDPTNLCNHKCHWCVSIEAHTGEKLELERFKSLVDELKQADVKSVVLKGGGEPTTHPQFVEMLDALQKAGLAVGLITNGSMPRAGTVEKVLEVCQWVRISLDAATAATHQAIHGSKDFAKIMLNIGELAWQSRKTMVGLNFVAEPRNYQEMVEFTAMARSLGVAYVTIRCVFDPANPLPPEMRDAMRAEAIAARQLETGAFRVFLGNFTDRYLNADTAAPFPYARCMGPNLIGIVGGDGDVYACCFLRGNKAFSFGNINQQSFGEVWNSPRRQQVMNAVYRGECGRVCAGGMTANRYNTYNEILNYLCAEEKRHSAFA